MALPTSRAAGAPHGCRHVIGSLHLLLGAVLWLPLMAPDLPGAATPEHALLLALLVIVPVFAGGFGQILLPPLLAGPDMAFPKISLATLGLHAAGVCCAVAGIARLAASPPWFAGAIMLGGAGAFLASANVIVTVISMRGPGITPHRMPLFAWAELALAGVLILLLPVLAGAFTIGGAAMPAVPWPPPHPLIYVLLLPALGIVTEVLHPSVSLPRLARARTAWAWLFLAAFGTVGWMHGVFVPPRIRWLEPLLAVCTALLIVTAAPAAYRCRGAGVAQLWALGAVFIFVTGLAAEIPLLAGNSPGALAHVRHVLSLGSLFSAFAGFYCWFGQIAHRRLSRGWGRAHFAAGFVGTNLGLLPMHAAVLFPALAGRPFWTIIHGIGFDLACASWLCLLAAVACAFTRASGVGDDGFAAWMATREAKA